MHQELLRAVAPALQQALQAMPVVVLTGPRQAGKSTLAQAEGDATRRYRTLDSLGERAAAQQNPEAFIRSDQHLTIDEVQHAPDLLLAIKREVDQQRTARVPGRYLLTGSANLLLLKTVSESLAGRATYITLWPFTRRERLGTGTAGIWRKILETPPEGWESLLRRQPHERSDWRAEVRRGGFPVPSLHMHTSAERALWFDGYVQTYLERDFTGLSAVENLLDVRALMRAVALRIGNLVNQTELGRDVQMSQPRVRGYLNLLETSYQLVRLAPFTRSRTTRLIKTPKAYWNDPGLALHLSGEAEPTGAHFENLVLIDLLSWRSTVTPRPDILYWRAATGDNLEVDFVIEAAKQLLPVEVKNGRTVMPRDARGLQRFLADNPKQARAGLILHDGDDTFWIADNVLAAPWWMVL
jgi:predicted AAA+ superfamily ATPase